MEQDWAKEPWRIEDIWVMSADEDRLHPILTCGLDHYVDRDCVPRIVACVNACAGIPTDILNAVPQGKACLNPMWYVEKEPPDAE